MGMDDRAFDALVEEHRAALVAYVARRLGPGLAEDAVQEALLSAHRALAAGARPDEMGAWLRTIALRRGLDLARRQPRPAADLDRVVLPDGGPTPEETAIMADELGDVLDAWAALPERQRSALAMSVLEGRTLDEIGARLDVGRVGAKSLVARARRRLALGLPAFVPIGVLVRIEARIARLREILVTQAFDAPVQAGVKVCAVACAATVAMPGAAIVDPGPPPAREPLATAPVVVARAAQPRTGTPARVRPRAVAAPVVRAAAVVTPAPVARPTPRPMPVPVATAVAGRTVDVIETAPRPVPAGGGVAESAPAGG